MHFPAERKPRSFFQKGFKKSPQSADNLIRTPQSEESNLTQGLYLPRPKPMKQF